MDTALQHDDKVIIGSEGGYLRQWLDKKKHFEVIAGKSIANGSTKCFGFVQTYDSKPSIRLLKQLPSQGIANEQDSCFISAGEKTLRCLRKSLRPQSQQQLDWFHLTRKSTVLGQFIKGIAKIDKKIADDREQALELTKWHLWHGKVDRDLARYLEFELTLYDIDQEIFYERLFQLEDY